MPLPAHPPYHVRLVACSQKTPLAANREKGATTRMMQRVMNRLQALYGVGVSFRGLDPDYAALMDKPMDAPGLIVGVRLQDLKWEAFTNRLVQLGVPYAGHFADPHPINRNDDPLSPITVRSDLQTFFYENAQLVFAGSKANTDLAATFNPNSWYIPNPVDADAFLAPHVEWAGRSQRPLRWLGYSYGMHGIGNLTAAYDFATLNAHGAVHDFTYVTEIKKKISEIPTHTHAGDEDVGALLQIMALKNPAWMHVETSFTPDKLYTALQNTDLVLVSRDPLEKMTPYQVLWQNYRDAHRASLALAFGRLPVVLRQEGLIGDAGYPRALIPFIVNNCVITCNTLAEGVETARSLSKEKTQKMIAAGQKLLRETADVDVVAAQHHARYQQVLGLN